MGKTRYICQCKLSPQCNSTPTHTFHAHPHTHPPTPTPPILPPHHPPKNKPLTVSLRLPTNSVLQGGLLPLLVVGLPVGTLGVEPLVSPASCGSVGCGTLAPLLKELESGLLELDCGRSATPCCVFCCAVYCCCCCCWYWYCWSGCVACWWCCCVW